MSGVIKMKQITFVFAVIIILLVTSISTLRGKEINLVDMQVPNSPAFVLLDAAPTSVEKPTSTKAFAVSIMNALNENNGIPKNYAVEFTPFWFMKHPTLTALKFWGIDSDLKKQLPFSALPQYSVSFALVSNKPNDTLTNPTTTNVSFGIRTTILRVRSDDDKQDLITENKRIATRLSTLNDSLSNIVGQITMLSILPLDSTNEIARIERQMQIDLLKQEEREILGSFENDSELIKHEQSVQEILARRPMFAIEGAIASNAAFDNNDFSTKRLGRVGGWLNLAYAVSLNTHDAVVKKNYLNAVITTRYLSDHNQRSTNGFVIQNLFDSGGKLELEIDKFSISGEYLYRWNSTDKTKNSFRASGLLKYKIKDDLYLTSAFGRNFGDRNNLISQFGISWGIGTGNEKINEQ
jgi:hypothetical protein